MLEDFATRRRRLTARAIDLPFPTTQTIDLKALSDSDLHVSRSERTKIAAQRAESVMLRAERGKIGNIRLA